MTADENNKISPFKEEVVNGEVTEVPQTEISEPKELTTSPPTNTLQEVKPPVLPKDEFTPSPLSRSRPALPRKSSKRSPPQLPRRRASSLKSEGSVEDRIRSIQDTKISPTKANVQSPEANPSIISGTQDLPILQELASNNNSSGHSIASGNTLSVPETNARKSLDNMNRPTNFNQDFIAQLSELECGTDPILERNRLSVNTIRLISKFLKRKAFLEEEYSKQVSKTIQQTLKEMEKEEVYEGAFTIGFKQILDYHEALAKNRLKFSLETNQISDELNNISKDRDRIRKSLKDQQIRDHKRLVDAEIGLEKSYNRYINTSDAWDQSVVLKHNGGRISPDQNHSTILNHVPKQVATTFGLFNKPKSLDQLIKQEEECKARAMISKDQYSIQLFHLNNVKKEYYTKLMPSLIRDSLDNINQCDYWAQFYLSTYSHNYQTLIQQEAKIMGSSLEGLDGAIEKIQPIEDTHIFLNSLLTKFKSANMEPIQMQEYQHSSAAQTALNSRAIFGVDLRGQLARDRVRVPIIITKCAEFIEKIGIDFEGIYRVSGATTKIQKLKSLFDHDASKVDLDKIDYAYDISNVAGVLKLYLRELPEPLIPSSILEKFMPLMPIEGEDPPQLQKFQTLLVQLPIHSYETIKYLILHLTKVMVHSDVNKMTASNLAIVFGPTLFSPPGQDNTDAVSNMTSQCQATLIMIKYSQKLFERSPTLPERSPINVPDHLGKLRYQSFDEQNTSGLKIEPVEFIVNKDGVRESVQSPENELEEMPLALGGPILPNTVDSSDPIDLGLPSSENPESTTTTTTVATTGEGGEVNQLQKPNNEPPHD